MIFDKCIRLYYYCHDQDTEHLSCLQKVPSCPFTANFPPLTLDNHWPAFFHYRLVLPVLEIHKIGSVQYVPFCVWLLWLLMIHPCCSCIMNSLCFIAGVVFHCLNISRWLYLTVLMPIFFTAYFFLYLKVSHTVPSILLVLLG